MISINELLRFQRALKRFNDLCDRHYPGLDINGDVHEVVAETVRNAQTAEAFLPGWINYRLTHHKDPIDQPLVTPDAGARR